MGKKTIMAAVIGAFMAAFSSCAGDIGKLSQDIDYLAYVITESNHPALEEGVHAYMVRNKEKDCYYFRKTNDTPASLELICKGTWAPAAGRLMVNELEEMKDINILDMKLSIKSALQNDREAELDVFAQQIVDAM